MIVTVTHNVYQWLMDSDVCAMAGMKEMADHVKVGVKFSVSVCLSLCLSVPAMWMDSDVYAMEGLKETTDLVTVGCKHSLCLSVMGLQLEVFGSLLTTHAETNSN